MYMHTFRAIYFSHSSILMNIIAMHRNNIMICQKDIASQGIQLD